jgi:acyl-coenzyme A synthetase/AMP-(fatty) acid ligase
MSGAFCVPNWISSGNTIVIYDVNDEELILQSVEKYKLDMLPLFPAFGYRILDEHSKNNYDLSTLKFMGTAGSKFPGNVV